MEVNPEAEGVHPLPESPAPAAAVPEPPAPAEAPASPDAPLSTPPGDVAGAAEPSAEDPAPETGASEPSESAPAEAAAPDPLGELANRALRGRLPPADEERATQLLKETLLEGRLGLTRAIEHLPKLPWLICVNGVCSAWPELKPATRTRLMAGLARVDSDAARRVRLSLARGIFKIDPPAAVKIAINIAKDMREKETGGISIRNAQILANVLIGRAKPWIIQLPLADLKPVEIDLLIHTALMTVFSLPHPPASQLGILKWAAEHDRLSKLSPVAVEAVKKGVARWNPKWQIALKNEVKDLPEDFASLLKSEEPRPAEPRGDRRDRGRGRPENNRPERSSAEAEPGGPAPAASEEASEAGEPHEPRDPRDFREPREIDDEDDEDDDEEDDREDEQDEREREREKLPVKQRPVYESKTVNVQPQGQQQRGRGPQSFNLSETLRQIEQHVASLRSELQATQQKLRQRDDDSRKPRRGQQERAPAPVIEGEPTPEELARLNLQLEARNAELQARLDEFRADSEDRAASSAAALEGASVDPAVQLRALLVFKLQEDYEDFVALEREAPDIVVQQHYRALLRHVFEVLRVEGVSLQEPKLSD